MTDLGLLRVWRHWPARRREARQAFPPFWVLTVALTVLVKPTWPKPEDDEPRSVSIVAQFSESSEGPEGAFHVLSRCRTRLGCEGWNGVLTCAE